jgi:hypothetical protein
MNDLWGRAALLSCCRRRLCRVRRWLRRLLRRWQTGEAGWALRMSCRCCRRRRWGRRVCCRRLRRRLPSFCPCRGSRWRRSARAELHRLRRHMRPDPRGGQMREIRYTRRMAGYWCRRGRTGGGLRCRGCRRRRLASSRGGRLRSLRCCWRFLRGLRHEVDARCRSECREIWPSRRMRWGRRCGFGLNACRGWRQCRRHDTAGSRRHCAPGGGEWRC